MKKPKQQRSDTFAAKFEHVIGFCASLSTIFESGLTPRGQTNSIRIRLTSTKKNCGLKYIRVRVDGV